MEEDKIEASQEANESLEDLSDKALPAEEDTMGEASETQEAEADVQISEDTPPPAVELKEESRFRRAFRRTLRWGAGLLLIFALGMLTATVAFYLPQSRILQQTETEKREANLRITALESEVDTLSAQVQDLNRALEAQGEELDSTDTHTYILSALADVRAAQVLLAEEDLQGPLPELTKVSETLTSLGDLVGDEHGDDIAAMLTRLDLVVNEIDEEPDKAKVDLEFLATSLLRLENTLFVEP